MLDRIWLASNFCVRPITDKNWNINSKNAWLRQLSRRIVISFWVVELKQKFCPAPQVLFELGHHFGNSDSGRHHTETSSSMFYLVQKEQPCLSRFGKMGTKSGFLWTRHVSPHVHVIKWADKIIEVPNKLISRSFDSIMKPSEHCPFPWRWNRLTIQSTILSVSWCGSRDGNLPINSEIRTLDNDNWRLSQKDLPGVSSKVDQFHS